MSVSVIFLDPETVLDNFWLIFKYQFCGLGLRVRAMIWVMVRVTVGVVDRIIIVLWSG